MMNHCVRPNNLTLIICLFSCIGGWSQPITLSREFGVNIGFSNFLGDLGGSGGIGRALWWDIDPEVTRPAIGLVFRQELVPQTAFRLNLYGSMLYGDDALSNNEFRNYRNLSFRSPVIEASAYLEFDFNRFSGTNKKKWTPYLYGGIGAFYFNPQAYYNGEWIDLQPLGTEGQGLPQYPDRKKYSRVAMCFPIGAGFKVLTHNNLVVGFEMASRFTTTDYIDDVSNSYPNPDYYFLTYDSETALLAAELSDRSDGSRPDLITLEGPRGGQDNNDTYIFGGLLTLTYHLEFQKKIKIDKCYFDSKNKK